MIERTDAGVAVGQLAAIGPVVIDEFRKRRGWNGGMHREREGRHRDVGDRFKILEWIVERTGLQNCFGHVGARAAEQQRVTVGSRMRDESRAERTAAAALVFHKDGAEK